MPEAGEVLGHFRLESQLGRGGMGEVWLAYDLRLERRVAIKLLRDEQRLRPGARERMLREARALSRVEHPAICQIYEILELEDADALVLEFVEGKTLAAGPLESLTSLEKLQIGIEIAEALSVAHRHGIVHRDLKAENIMIDSNGEVKVLDFGVARFVAGTELPPLLAENPNLKETQEAVGSFGFSDVRDFQTRRGVIVGTLHAMSPEQARGEEITAASDLFSLGLLLPGDLHRETSLPRGSRVAGTLPPGRRWNPLAA